MSQIIKSRFGVPDLLKGISVLLMIQVHLMELFAKPEILGSSFGKISLFLGGSPAAPLFMLIMGYFCSLNKGVSKVLIRGFQLILFGISLNLLLNANLLFSIYKGTFAINPWEYIWGVDIFFLAGLSLIFIALLHFIFSNKWFLFVGISFLIVLVSPYIQQYFVNINKSKYLLAYFGGKYSWSYFSFFPWVAYPLLGYGFKLLHQKYSNFYLSLKIEYSLLAFLSIALLFTGKWAINISSNLEKYYHHEILFFLWVLGFVILVSLLARRINIYVESRFLEYIKWIGKHVTSFYIIQWIIIGNIATEVFKTQDISSLIAWYLGIVFICVLLVRFVLGKQLG